MTVAAAPPPEEAPNASEPAAISLPELAAFNRCDKQPKGSRFRITLPEEAELKDLVGWISTVSCQKFVWDPAVRGGKITIVAPEPVTLAEAYGAFHSALQTMNLAVQDAGDFFEIVETKGIAGRTVPVVGPDGKPAPSDRFVTQVVRPHEERLADVAAVFDHLKSEHGAVTTVGEIIIVTDTANNIRRAMRVAKQVDVAEETREGLYVYPLKNAEPEELAELLQQILGDSEDKAAAKPSRRPKSTTKKKGKARSDAPAADAAVSATSAKATRIVPDARTRSLFIVAPREDYPVIQDLIDRLDTTMGGEQGQITVVRLDYAKAEELQPVLMQVIGQRKDTDAQITVTAEPTTRSLIIDAPYLETQRLQQLIASLDVERRQVYMEVYLLEVTMDHSLETGAGAHFARQNADGTLGVVSTNPSLEANSILPNASALQGLAAGIFGPGVSSTLLGQDVPSFGVIIQAIENNTDVNTISEPHVTTADNRTAKITIGEVVPFQDAVTTPGGVNGNQGQIPFASVSRQPVALEVEITPHVNGKREVMLDINLLNEQLLPASQSDLGFSTSKRTLELQDVLAHDGQPVVLGGLIKDEESIIETRVPGLAKIPLLGWLFKSRKRPKTKVNLLMILIPHIIESPDDARRIHQQRMAERREFLERETSFKRKDLATHVNYRKKAGLLTAVQAEHKRMRIEDEHRHRADLELRRGLPTEITTPTDAAAPLAAR
ncbi:MAG: secretin N-terminal domain-containing protein [Myxococcota bacterium]